MQIIQPGNFFQAVIFSKKSKWIHKKIPPGKNNPAGIYKPLGHPSNY